jgi:hypothetical protein
LYRPKGWDRDMYRPPDDIMFEVRKGLGGGLMPNRANPLCWDRLIRLTKCTLVPAPHPQWQELLCCLRFMDEKDVNAAMLAPETRDMMIGYAEAVMARGSPVNTIEGLQKAMLGKWKLAFTTEERYRVLPPATRVVYQIRPDGTMDNIVKVRAWLGREGERKG